MSRYRHRGQTFWPPRAPVDAHEEEAVRARRVAEPECANALGPFFCARIRGHGGDHVALYEGAVVARWPQAISVARGRYQEVFGSNHCPQCGARGVWRSLALTCPDGCGAFG